MLFFFSGVAMVFIGIAIGLFVVFPRRARRKQKGILYWDAVRMYAESEYIDELSKVESNELLFKLISHNYVLSGILSRKYMLLNRAFAASIIGYLLLVFTFILDHFFY